MQPRAWLHLFAAPPKILDRLLCPSVNMRHCHGHGLVSVLQIQSLGIEDWRRHPRETCLVQHIIRQPVRSLILLAWYLLEKKLDIIRGLELEDQTVDLPKEVFVDDGAIARGHEVVVSPFVDVIGHAVD